MIEMMTFHFEYMLWTTITSAANEKIGNFLFGMNCVWTFKEFPLSCFWFPHEYFGNLRINSARNSHSMHEIDFSFIWFPLHLLSISIIYNFYKDFLFLFQLSCRSPPVHQWGNHCSVNHRKSLRRKEAHKRKKVYSVNNLKETLRIFICFVRHR